MLKKALSKTELNGREGGGFDWFSPTVAANSVTGSCVVQCVSKWTVSPLVPVFIPLKANGFYLIHERNLRAVSRVTTKVSQN